MALVLRGLSECPICGQVINDSDNVVMAPAFLASNNHPLWKFNDAGMHAACFSGWNRRDSFIAAFNDYFARHYRGMRVMLENGDILKNASQADLHLVIARTSPQTKSTRPQ